MNEQVIRDYKWGNKGRYHPLFTRCEKEIREELKKLRVANRIHPETIILEPSYAYDLGIVGYNEEQGRLIYSIAKLIPALMEHHDWTEQEAIEWLEYNTLGSTTLKHYPLFVEGWEDE